MNGKRPTVRAIENIISVYWNYHDKAIEEYQDHDLNLDAAKRDKTLRDLIREANMTICRIKEVLER